VSRQFDSVTTRKIRIRLRRIDGNAPQIRKLGTGFTQNAPYSLAIRAFDVGYRVRSRGDFPVGGGLIGTTTDTFGSQVQFEVVEQDPSNVLTVSEEVWRCEPQPVNYSVVNMYLDTRGDGGGT